MRRRLLSLAAVALLAPGMKMCPAPTPTNTQICAQWQAADRTRLGVNNSYGCAYWVRGGDGVLRIRIADKAPRDGKAVIARYRYLAGIWHNVAVLCKDRCLVASETDYVRQLSLTRST